MPPRFVYWTIIAGGLPTAFRAAEREELEPTFQRIREKHPDAEMKYFAQGKLWDSQEQAKQARDEARGGFSSDRPTNRPEPGARERRNRDWRPGGEHKDPRQKFKDQKQQRNQRWRAEKFEHRNRGKGIGGQGEGGPREGFRGKVPFEKPHGDPLRRDVKPQWREAKPQWREAKPQWRDQPWPPKRQWEDRPPKRDWRDKPAPPTREGSDTSRPPSPPQERGRGPGGPAGGKRPFQGRGGSGGPKRPDGQGRGGPGGPKRPNGRGRGGGGTGRR